MEDKQVKTVCPLCGSSEYIEQDLDDEVKDAFLESILGCAPFTRTYDVMDGKMAITVAAMTDEANNIRSRFVVKVANAADKCPDLKAYMPLLDSALDTDGQIVSVEVTTKDHGIVQHDRRLNKGTEEATKLDWDSVTNDNCSEFIAQVLGVFENNMFNGIKVPSMILRGAVGKHNTVISRLVKACLDENFLSGTGR